MRTAIYCRVSTDDQEKEGTSLQTQREACLAYCKQKGYEVARQFTETYSGLTLERPKLTELRDLVRTNDLDIIVVYCLDRFSRDPAHGAMLFQQLEEHNVRLEAVTETIETTDLGKLISYIRGFASKVEAEKIRERTMRGKLARLKEGKLPHGTGLGIYGYDWNKDTGHRTINNVEEKVVQKMFTMALQGFSFNRIAIELNKAGIQSKSGSMWHPLTIKRIVMNETYTGKTYSGKTKRVSRSKVTTRPQNEWFFLPDVTPQIIDDETFKHTQEVLEQAKQSRPIKENSPFLLTGFMKCSKCGSPIGGTTLSGKYRYYQCRGARPTSTRGKICDARYIKANAFEKEIWNKVNEMLYSPLTYMSMLTDIAFAGLKQPSQQNLLPQLEKQIKQLRKKLKAYPAKEKNLYDLLSYEAVTKDYILDTVNKLKLERENDHRQLDGLLATRSNAAGAEQVAVKLSDLSEAIRLDALEAQQESPNPTDGLETKRTILEKLKLAVLVQTMPLTYQFNFKLGGMLISTEEADAEALFKTIFKEFEQQHPNMSIEELLDFSKQLPEDTTFAKVVNQVKKKNLVTIEQTSGCSSNGKNGKLLGNKSFFRDFWRNNALSVTELPIRDCRKSPLLQTAGNKTNPHVI